MPSRLMRTTVTLDDDVAAALKRRSRESDLPFKQVLNDTLRSGLFGGRRAKPYRMKPTALGIRPEIDLTRALAIADQLEDTELVHKLERGR
jgi:hypothetical protein